MATTSRSNRSLFQSWGEVEQGNGSPEVNPFKVYNPFDILTVEGLVDDPVCSNNMNTASIGSLGRENVREFRPANTGLVYAKSCDVTASRSTQTGGGRQARVADEDAGKSKNNRYLHHSELKYVVGEVERGAGHSSDRTDEFSKVSVSGKTNFNVNVNKPIHVFTLSEGVIVEVYDECVKGICFCDYKLQGGKLQLKLCRFAYLVSLGTAECKRAYEPLVSDITDGF